MTGLLNRLSDRLLAAVAPKAVASACACSAELYCHRQWNGQVLQHQWCRDNCNCGPSYGGWTNGDCPP